MTANDVNRNLDWETPTLEVLGDLAALTAAGGGEAVDGDGASSPTI